MDENGFLETGKHLQTCELSTASIIAGRTVFQRTHTISCYGERDLGARVDHGSVAPLYRVAAFTRSHSFFPALKNTTDFPSISTASPVRGLRPFLGSRLRTLNAPKPRNSTRQPSSRWRTIVSKIVETTISAWERVRWGFSAASFATNSVLSIAPPLPRL